MRVAHSSVPIYTPVMLTSCPPSDCPRAMLSIPLKPLCSFLPGMLGPFDRHSASKFPCSTPIDVPEDAKSTQSLFNLWSSSRVVGERDELILTPGGQRPMTGKNISLAIEISERCITRILSLLWSIHPLRVLLMVSLDIFRGVLPACRGYSQALIINEVCFPRLLRSECRSKLTEIFRSKP